MSVGRALPPQMMISQSGLVRRTTQPPTKQQREGEHRRSCPIRPKFWTQICLPTQFTLDKAWGRVQLFVGVLVMRIEQLPRNKQRRPAEPSLWVAENNDSAVSLLEKNDEPLFEDDERGDDIPSLLEENARLRGLLVKLSDLLLKNLVDAK